MCDDGIKNGAETHVDCGGSSCAGCGATDPCSANADCLGGICTDSSCAACGDNEWAQWVPGDVEWTVRSVTVRDDRTGLTWAREAASARPWQDALDYCLNNPYDEGIWRLPTRIELTSIVDHERAAPPTVDTGVFRGIGAEGFWTATPNAADGSQAWFVSFAAGNVDIDDKTEPLRVLCVR